MNRFFAPLLFCLFLLAVPALAVEETAGEETQQAQEPLTAEVETDDKNIVVNVTVPSAALPLEEEAPAVPSYPAYSVSALDDVPEQASETFSSAVNNLFGQYTPRTQTVTEYLADGTSVTYTQVIPGLAGLDYPWLASVSLFALLLYGLLRLLGGLLKL